MCDICENNGYIEDICGYCNGSGEGMYDGSTCYQCKGSGVEIIICDCNCDEGKDYAMMVGSKRRFKIFIR